MSKTMTLQTQKVSRQGLWMNWLWPTTTFAEQTADVLKSGKLLTLYGDILSTSQIQVNQRCLYPTGSIKIADVIHNGKVDDLTYVSSHENV